MTAKPVETPDGLVALMDSPKPQARLDFLNVVLDRSMQHDA
jgi:hypothetical protein